MLAGCIAPALERAFFGIAAVTLEKKLQAFTTAKPAF
jgi:hypothetical protein